MRSQSKNSAARSEVRSPASTADARSGCSRLPGSRPRTSTRSSAIASTATITIAMRRGTGTSLTLASAHRGERALEPLAQLHARLPAELVARAARVDRDALYLAGAFGLELRLELVARAAHLAQRVDELEHRRLHARADVVRPGCVGVRGGEVRGHHVADVVVVARLLAVAVN